MNQNTIREAISAKVKLIRIENNYTQEQMAKVIGLSKKSLIQIEKRRTIAGWTTTVTICALFRNSEMIRNTLGDNTLETLDSAARHL